MINHPQIKSPFVRVLLIAGLILPAIIPLSSFVSAQGEMAHFSIPHFIYTSEFGVDNPQGMAFSPDAQGFFVWGSSQSANVISVYEELTGKINFAQNIPNPFGAAFDNHSHSLFILGAGNAELSKVEVGSSGIPDPSAKAAERFNIGSFDLQDAEGMSFDPATGRLFVLDAGRGQFLIVSPHPADGFDGASAVRNNRVRRANLNSLSKSALRGLAFNPGNGHVYIGSPGEQRIYELTETGQKVKTYDVGEFQLGNPSTMLFAPSRDTTDDPNTLDLFILDGAGTGQTAKTPFSARAVSPQQITSSSGQIVELSLRTATGLPSGTTLLPATFVRITDTSTWGNPSPDPSGIDYWPLTGKLLIDDSEVEEEVNGNPPVYWHLFNVFHSTLGGSLTGNCTTFTSNPTSLLYNNFTNEPSGLAINPSNNHIFITSDGFNSRVFEVSPGADATYCTADDIVAKTQLSTLYGAGDSEDVAYGNNTVFIADGVNAEVYVIPLGANGILGGGDDGPVTHFDTSVLGFNDLEGIGYNSTAGTLFIVSTQANENYLGEITTSGVLVNAYDLSSFMGIVPNIRSDVAYAPSSQNAAVKSIYIVSRGADNNQDRFENDGKIWEIALGSPPPTATPTNTPTKTPTPTATPTNTPTSTPTPPAGTSHTNVYAAGTLQGGYDIAPKSSIRKSYAGLKSGPVKVSSSVPIAASQRTAYSPDGGTTWTSYSEMMGLASNQLATSYTFPYYDNTTSIKSELRFANVGTTTTQVTVVIGNLTKGPYPLAPNTVKLVSFPLKGGPVQVKSSGGVPIVASMRFSYKTGAVITSSSEMMGLPTKKLTTTYLFPFYDSKTSIRSQLRIANLGTATTTVKVTVKGVLKGTYTLAPKAVQFDIYPALSSGPVKVQSSGGVPIIASLNFAYIPSGTTIITNSSEMMGQPSNSLSTRFSFPIYDSVHHNSQLRIANVGSAATTVTVTINGVLKGTYPLLPNTFKLASFGGVDSGPVVVQSSGNIPILVSKRVQYSLGATITSFSEMMGLPNSQLVKIYYFPLYDNVTVDSQLRFGVP